MQFRRHHCYYSFGVLLFAVATGFFASSSKTDDWFIAVARWAMGSRASGTTTSNHRDPSRSPVGWTAFLVALMRAIESSSSSSETAALYDRNHHLDDEEEDNNGGASTKGGVPLLHDPVAMELFSIHNYYKDNTVPLSARLMFALFRRNTKSNKRSWPLRVLSASKMFSKLESTINLVAVRTHFIDRHIRTSLQQKQQQQQQQLQQQKIEEISSDRTRQQQSSTQHNHEDDDRHYRNHHNQHQQLVIIGAGLDARSFRLAPLFAQTGTTVFEVDFPGMISEKVRLFRANGFAYDRNCGNEGGENSNDKATPSSSSKETASAKNTPLSCSSSRLVGADLAKPEEMKRKLIENGFDANLPTVWLLEGVTGYLLKEELDALLSAMRSLSSSSGSRLIATWLTSKMVTGISMHKFFLDDGDESSVENMVTEVVGPHGFSKAIEATTLKDEAEKLHRSGGIDSYVFSCHEMV